MAIVLSDATDERLVRMFDGHDLQEARSLLEKDCAENIPGWSSDSPAGLQLLRIAVLKLSSGTIAGLVDAIVLAQTDWRDALVCAGFGDDPSLHESWWPE